MSRGGFGQQWKVSFGTRQDIYGELYRPCLGVCIYPKSSTVLCLHNSMKIAQSGPLPVIIAEGI